MQARRCSELPSRPHQSDRLRQARDRGDSLAGYATGRAWALAHSFVPESYAHVADLAATG